MCGQGGRREFRERVRTQGWDAGEDAEAAVVEPPNDVVMFESFDGVEEVGALPKWLIVASTKPDLMGEFDSADGDPILADGDASIEISGEENSAGSDERRVDDLEVGVVQREVRLRRAHQRGEAKHVRRSRVGCRVIGWMGHLLMIGWCEWITSHTAYQPWATPTG